jgi:hypothetical protein
MNQTAACYASPKIVRVLTKVFGDEVSTVKVTMRRNKDVPRFLQRLEAAHKKTAKNRLQFD